MTMFTEMKQRLEDRTRSFGAQMDAAADARQRGIDVQLAEARTRAAASRAALAAQGGPSTEAIEADVAEIKRRIAAEGARDASRTAATDADAVAAERSARYVFDLALTYLDEAAAAALEASYARDRAYVMAHEAAGDAPGEGRVSAGSKVGALVDQVVGSAKRDLGKATGSTRMEIEGAAQEERGHADWAAGKAP